MSQVPEAKERAEVYTRKNSIRASLEYDTFAGGNLKMGQGVRSTMVRQSIENLCDMSRSGDVRQMDVETFLRKRVDSEDGFEDICRMTMYGQRV